MNRSPRGFQRIGQALGRAHQPRSARLLADGDDDPFADGEAARQRMATGIVEHLCIDRLCRAAQRQFAQRGQVRLGKKMIERPARLSRDIDFALLQPLDQFVGQYVDDLDLGCFQYRIGNSLTHAHPREGRDDIVQTLDMLDIDGGENVDPRIQQLFDVLISLGMAAARRIAVGKFVDKDQLGASIEDGVYVHLADAMPGMIDNPPGNDLMPIYQRLGFPAPVRFHHADHHIDTGGLQPHAIDQHVICLADTRCSTKEDLEAASSFLRGGAQEGLRRGSVVTVVHGATVALIRSSRRFRSSTLMRGSPGRPGNGRAIVRSTSARTVAGANPRAAATCAT